MFRKEYKQANDNIKVDEALLEKTLEAAFAEKPKKKTYYYRSFAPVAAALLIVIGATSAYPKLIKEPDTEKTLNKSIATSTVSPTFNPSAELKFDAVSEPTAAPEKSEPAKANTKPVKKSAEKTDTVEVQVKPDDIPVAAEAVSEPVAMEAAIEVSEAEVPSVARGMINEPIEAYSDSEQSEEGFLQVSCKFLDGAEEYVYENESGKSFTVTVTKEGGAQGAGLSAERNGNVYVFWSDNMTDSEILAAFETLNI